MTQIPPEDRPQRSDDRESLAQRVAYLQYSSMELAAMRLPEGLGRRLFAFYAGAFFHLAPSVRATVAANLAPVLGSAPDSEAVGAATREAFRLYGRYWFDSFRTRVMSKEEVGRRFKIEDLENVDLALERGRGAIVALPHMGNWDLAGRYLCVNGYRLAAVAEELKPRRMYELFLHHRRELGMRIVPLTSDRRAGLELAALLADNWVVALVADRDLTGRGVEVEMFGRRRRMPAGPALLSLRTGATLHSCPVRTTDTGTVCRIGPALEIESAGDTRSDVITLTRMIAAEWERDIAADPSDWHVFQPAWEDEPAS